MDLPSGRQLTYHTFDRRISALAGHLWDGCAVVPGARVAWLAHNATEAFVHSLPASDSAPSSSR